MIRQRTINLLLALVLALILATSFHLDGPTDHSAERAQADSLDDALKTEAARVKQAKRIAKVCGINAAFVELGDGQVQCMTHRGHKTMIAQVQP